MSMSHVRDVNNLFVMGSHWQVTTNKARQ
jgi:hypothetical protein